MGQSEGRTGSRCNVAAAALAPLTHLLAVRAPAEAAAPSAHDTGAQYPCTPPVELPIIRLAECCGDSPFSVGCVGQVAGGGAETGAM